MIALGIVTATAAAFVISAVYYSTMPAGWSPEPTPRRSSGSLALVEGVRNLSVAALIAGLLAVADWNGLGAGMLLGLALWIIPVVLLAGSVFHEGVPVVRAALHGVDWLIKLVAIGAIAGLFR